MLANRLPEIAKKYGLVLGCDLKSNGSHGYRYSHSHGDMRKSVGEDQYECYVVRDIDGGGPARSFDSFMVNAGRVTPLTAGEELVVKSWFA